MSKNPLLLKLLLIVAVVATALVVSYPPKEKINLGLDLRGGAYILMQVDLEDAVQNEVEVVRERFLGNFQERNLTFTSILPAGKAIEIKGTSAGQTSEVRELIDSLSGRWTVSSAGSGGYRVTMPSDVRAFIETEAVEVTLTSLRNRIDALGVAEPSIQKQGQAGDRILIQLPGVQDLLGIEDIISEPAVLEWKALAYPPGVSDFGNWVPPAGSREATIAMFGGSLPADAELLEEKRLNPDGTTLSIWWPLKVVSVIRGTDLRAAYPDSDEWGEAAVSFELTADAGKRFFAATQANLGRKMAIVLSDKVLSAPVINGAIRDRGIIQGGFTFESAQQLAINLKAGSFPARVDIIEERTVGPSLGRDSIRAGLTSGIAGFVAVMLFMVFYYRLSGINAVVALALNVLLIFGVLGSIPLLFQGAEATLTLPGIAGLILTIGMAVDSNVLIFERIREELSLGKTVRSAVDNGFAKAFMTILDCNVTTLVAAFFLFSYGTGPVKGFAVTLTIGLLASMFTAVFVSRQLFEIALQRKSRSDSLSI